MTKLIRRAAHRLSLLFAPGTGTRRAGARQPSTPRPTAVRQPPTRCTRPTLPPHRSPYCRHLPLDGTENRLVRPYLTAHEHAPSHNHAHEHDRQAHRRLALVLAADFGIDLDQHLVGAGKAAV
ncbi:hypothetical protein F9278_25625 [Streptomyces phaeolivaceus]|uniref:Uncharacterized protein n=1 Tax=Streptomyces phaeolivaceus TaxID=2653200 RepID=A0A5P8K824_9ACTN|nr:hypothetical protein [Streptomyces phaeolivaceus]QFQ98972.1 hypothetical protein F9278_25625 [Streptomyces phaeolivaceus]